MVPTDPDLLTNAHATTKMHLESRNFWKTGVKTFFMSFSMFYLPKYTNT